MPSCTGLCALGADGNPRSLVGLAFDCDGVMFDSRHTNVIYYNMILQFLDLPPMTREQENYVHAHAVRESLAHIVPRRLWDRLEEVRGSIDARDLVPTMRPEPGLYEFLWWLRDQGLRLAVFTNRTTTMETVLDHFDLAHYFDLVVTAGMVRPKPHPEGMHRIMRAWGCGPREMAYLGDSGVDAESSRAAGVPLWAFRNEKLSADLHVADFWSLRRRLMDGFRRGA